MSVGVGRGHRAAGILGLIALVVGLVVLHGQQSTLPGQQPTPPGWNDNSQPTPGRDGVFTVRTGVQLVVQDITVTDANGKPVTGLKQEDFHIFDDGREQTIKNFEEHAPIDPALAEERAAALAHQLPPNTFTNYKTFKSDSVVVFVLDSLDMPVCAQMFLRQYMTEYMKTQPAGTPYIIFQLDTGLQMLQDLTTDRDALRTWVAGKRDHVEGQPQLAPDDPRAATWPAAQKRRQIVTGATKELQRYLAAIPGRKNMIWFGSLGSGLAIIDPNTTASQPTTVSIDPELPLDPVYSDPHSIDGIDSVWDPRAMPPPEEMKTNPTARTYLRDMTFSLEQSRIVMHTMGIGCIYQDGVPERIAGLVDRGAHYYTVSYTPTNQAWDGRPRKFSVEMADKTLRLEYRTSYLGSSNDTAVQRVRAPLETAAAAVVLNETTGPSPTLQTAMGMGTVEPTQIVFEASATRAASESKDPGNKPAEPGNFLAVKYRRQAYRDYTIHLRVRANELKLTQGFDPPSSYAGKLEFVAMVYDNQGQAVNGKREKVSVNFDSLTDAQLQTAELTGDLVIQVPAKGSYFLRLGVYDTASDRVGALEIPVDRIAPAGK
jgi:VWFA-related protein